MDSSLSMKTEDLRNDNFHDCACSIKKVIKKKKIYLLNYGSRTILFFPLKLFSYRNRAHNYCEAHFS